jgi:flagellin
MAVGDIQLTSALRANLISLQQTAKLLGRTEERLATNKKVNSALDNPANFFAARANSQRADLLNGLKDNIGEAIQTVKAADNGTESITTLIEALRGQLTQARTALNDSTNSATLLSGVAAQYNELVRQINNTGQDSAYKGVNFLSGGSLTVNFNEQASTSLAITGFNASASGLAITSGSAAGVGTSTSATFSTTAFIDVVEKSLNTALSTLQTESSKLSTNLTILSAREDFISSFVNTLVEGATNLTAADSNEEGANLLALQTRQALGVTSLSLASQAEQSVLRLF